MNDGGHGAQIAVAAADLPRSTSHDNIPDRTPHMTFEPVLQDRGEQARELLSAPGPVTVAEALALAVLNGDIIPPTSGQGGE